jgi:sec-independent protein translocase protein TatA
MESHPVFALGIGMPSGFEWVVIALALLLIFGRRLPEVMRGLGGSVREFKKGMEEGSPSTTAKPADAPPAPKVEGSVSRDATAAPPPPPSDPKPH